MTFKEYEYKRPDMKALEEGFNKALDQFHQAPSAGQQIDAIHEINRLRNNFDTQTELVMIRHSIDTTDIFYEEENNYIDEVLPLAEGLLNKYYEALLESSFKEALKEEFGHQLFRIAELKLKTFKPEIIEDLQQENKLSSQYVKLRASSKIMFEGEERNLSQMKHHLCSRQTERCAKGLKWQ